MRFNVLMEDYRGILHLQLHYRVVLLIVGLQNISAVEAHLSSLISQSCETRIVELPATTIRVLKGHPHPSHKAEVMIELAVPAKPTVVLPTTVYSSTVSVLLSLSLS